ncbi:hypothetical protein Ancab_022798 [Ancistrocladus abbreviatus]
MSPDNEDMFSKHNAIIPASSIVVIHLCCCHHWFVFGNESEWQVKPRFNKFWRMFSLTNCLFVFTPVDNLFQETMRLAPSVICT